MLRGLLQDQESMKTRFREQEIKSAEAVVSGHLHKRMIRDKMNVEYFCTDIAFLVQKVVGVNVLNSDFDIDQMRLDYSQVPSFFPDLVGLVTKFSKQNRQQRDQVEVADHSSWNVADAMEGGKGFLSNPDPAVLTRFQEGMKVCKELGLATGRVEKARGRKQTRWGPKEGDRGSVHSVVRELKGLLGDQKGATNADGSPRHCWTCGETSHVRAKCPKNKKP